MRKFEAEKIPKPPIQKEWEDYLVWALKSDQPLDVEIGCGVGLHPIRYSTANPGRNLIAIEHTREKFDKFTGRLANHDPLKNLLPVHANAISFVTHFLPESSVDRFFLLYPNPNPKKEHLNRRWHAMPFFGELLSKMKMGATLTLATNMEFYAAEFFKYATETWGLRPIGSLAQAKSISDFVYTGLPRTHFEKKYRERGETLWSFELAKT